MKGEERLPIRRLKLKSSHQLLFLGTPQWVEIGEIPILVLFVDDGESCQCCVHMLFYKIRELMIRLLLMFK